MTIFIDGLGRTISRDPKILETLLGRYKDTGMMILAQAGKEIEVLIEENTALAKALEATKNAKIVETDEAPVVAPRKKVV